MRFTEVVHGGLVHPRRVRVLAEHAARLIPPHANVLDVGTGDGLIAASIAALRPDLRIQGVDVSVRKNTAIPVAPFDGRVIPRPAGSVDVVTFFDVLHHANDPTALLREAARVARSSIVIKDHLCNSGFARARLSFMDDIGNKRYGVALPYNYWSSQQWSKAIENLRLGRAVWEDGGLGIYPWPASLVFGHGLHFLARLSVTEARPVEKHSGGQADTETWEAAYVRFEKPHEEIRKSIRRLRRLGADTWPKNAKILELFCGRGNGLVALERLGFTHVHGIDISPRLVGMSRGATACFVGDCRALPVRAGSHDVAIVQGGLHHLPTVPEDLERVIGEVQRVLKPGGLFVVVEPWRTLFLEFVHRVGCSGLGRRVWGKMDALATMIEHEGETYQRWLHQPKLISTLLCNRFEPCVKQERWGKLLFVGRNRSS